MTAATLDLQIDTDPMLPVPYQVDGRYEDTHDVVSLELRPAAGHPPMRFKPGQFTMLAIPGVGEVPISISGDLERPGVLVQTVRSVGAVTNAITSLRNGDYLGVRGPFGTRWPLGEATGRDLLIIAGGIGLAPLRPVVQHAMMARGDYRRVTLLYGARTPDELLYERELHAWRGQFGMEVEITVDRGGPGWHGDVGVVTGLFDLARIDPPETVAMVCGPEMMMRVVAGELRGMGVAAEDISVSIERNFKCGIGQCGHCQYGPDFACKDGPVMSWARVAERMQTPEV